MQNSNVPSGTCLDETSGLFTALNLDGNTQLQQDHAEQVRRTRESSPALLFAEQHQHSAFALTPQK
jgi:hypothetical protein